MRKQQFEELREEFIDLYRYGQSRSLRTKREIWSDVEKLLSKVGLNKGERLAVCNEFLEQARIAQKEANEEE